MTLERKSFSASTLSMSCAVQKKASPSSSYCSGGARTCSSLNIEMQKPGTCPGFYVGLAYLLARFWMSSSTTAGSARVEVRSEEHTSELQSRENLVCRLLL